MILWTDKIGFCICNAVCPNISFTGGSYRVGTSPLICNASELAVFYMQRFLNERYFRTNFNLVFLFLLILVKKKCQVDFMPDEYSDRKH